MTPPAARLRVGIVGAGRVGPVLGAALGGAGHSIVAVSAVSQSSLDRAEALLPGVPVLPVPDVIERSELVILAVPGSELAGLVAGLASTSTWRPGQLVAHTAPSLGTAVLDPATRAGAIPLALHPALSFTGTSVDLGRLRESFCAVTAPGPVQPIGQALAVELGCEPILIDEENRAAYGEAIATATEFSTAIVSQAVELLRGIGVDAPGLVLSSLVRSSVDAALAGADPDVIPKLDGDDAP